MKLTLRYNYFKIALMSYIVMCIYSLFFQSCLDVKCFNRIFIKDMTNPKVILGSVVLAILVVLTNPIIVTREFIALNKFRKLYWSRVDKIEIKKRFFFSTIKFYSFKDNLSFFVWLSFLDEKRMLSLVEEFKRSDLVIQKI